ncbi:MAG: hypothetical protein ACFFD4_26770 [Candidatus Odinarchaeota archaeon]
MTKNIFTLIYKDGDFTDGKPAQDDVVIIIDEAAERITLKIPSGAGLAAKRMAESKANSISRAGYVNPRTGISKIGLGYPVEITGEHLDKLPDSLVSMIKADGNMVEEISADKAPRPADASALTERTVTVPGYASVAREESIKHEKLGKLIYKLLGENKTLVVQLVHGVVTINTLQAAEQLKVD